MANRRRKFPTFFSFELGPVRGIAESMGDAEWGTWSKKALSDLSIGCIRKDTDPRVKELFNSSKDRMDTEYQRKHDWYEKKKSAGAPTREDGESKSGSGNAGNLGSATPATISQDASTRKDEDDSKAPTSCTVSPKEPVVLNLAYSGEFDNVRLTQEQYNDLLQHVGNMNDCKALIDDFSASIADGSTKSDNHFATLKKWAKARKRFDAEKKEGVPTFQEREGKRQSEQLRKYGLLK